jgi:predicted CoA-binding protein
MAAPNGKETVVILGASNKPDRYAYKALKSLTDAGHKVIPVTPSADSIEGIRCIKTLSEISESVDTITVYVRPEISTPMIGDFLKLRPKRVILNPGTENETLTDQLGSNGINVLEACTLVLLRTNQY